MLNKPIPSSQKISAIGMMVLALLGGPGILIYIVLWLVVPEEPTEAPIEPPAETPSEE